MRIGQNLNRDRSKLEWGQVKIRMGMGQNYNEDRQKYKGDKPKLK